jgi:hypothetical protein
MHWQQMPLMQERTESRAEQKDAHVSLETIGVWLNPNVLAIDHQIAGNARHTEQKRLLYQRHRLVCADGIGQLGSNRPEPNAHIWTLTRSGQ